MLLPPEYRDSPAFSKSDLNLYDKSPSLFYDIKIQKKASFEKESDHFDIGSIVDAILLDQQALKQYYVMTSLKAKGKVKEVLDKTYELYQQYENNKIVKTDTAFPSINDVIPFLQQAVVACEYQNNWEMITRCEKIILEGIEYWRELEVAAGRYIVSMDAWNKAHTVINNIKEDSSTHYLFNWLKGIDLPDGMEVLKQYAIYKEYKGLWLKALVDFAFVNHNTKSIFPWDLKSTDNLAKFTRDYREYNYGRQGSFYSLLLQLAYPGYRIYPFKFLVISKDEREQPEVFTMTDDEISLYRYGGELKNGYIVKGFEDSIENLKWHLDSGHWEHSRQYYHHMSHELNSNILKLYNPPIEEKGVIF